MSQATDLGKKLAEVEQRYQALEQQLSSPEVIANPQAYAKLAKEHAELGRVVTCFRQWRKTGQEIDDSQALLDDPDPEVQDLAREELDSLHQAHTELEQQLRVLLLPTDPLDEKNVLLEIRAGTGGEEASLFAADLCRMYTRYAEQKHWRMEVMSSSPTGLGRVQGNRHPD